MQTIYTEGARHIVHPRYVTNVSDQDMVVSYSSEQFTIRSGETVLTDLNIANIFANYGVVREHDPQTARVLSEVQTLVVSTTDPTLEASAQRRKAPTVAHPVAVTDPLRTELEELVISQLQARARGLNLKFDPKAKKPALVDLIHKEETELAAEAVVTE